MNRVPNPLIASLAEDLAPIAPLKRRNGWLLDPIRVVRPGEMALYFEAEPGSYFLRRLG